MLRIRYDLDPEQRSAFAAWCDSRAVALRSILSQIEAGELGDREVFAELLPRMKAELAGFEVIAGRLREKP